MHIAGIIAGRCKGLAPYSPDQCASDLGRGSLSNVCGRCMHCKADAQAIQSPAKDKDLQAWSTSHGH